MKKTENVATINLENMLSELYSLETQRKRSASVAQIASQRKITAVLAKAKLSKRKRRQQGVHAQQRM